VETLTSPPDETPAEFGGTQALLHPISFTTDYFTESLMGVAK
jgi:hypothetical protein